MSLPTGPVIFSGEANCWGHLEKFLVPRMASCLCPVFLGFNISENSTDSVLYIYDF